MANAIVGALRVVLGMDSAAFNKGANAAEKRISGMQKSMARAGKQLQGIGARISAGVTAPLVGLAYKSVDAMKVQERAVASVSQALASMGDGAGYTLGQLEAMASRLQEGSLYGDEEILSKVTANLLTFGNVSGDVFARASQLALDLSARLGTDLQSSTIMLGKALNDPAKGLTALTRVGVSFTKQQQEQIKAMAEAGDVAGAQSLMLAELEKQYAGQAKALASTDSGRVQQAWMAIGDAMEKIGAVILPIMADVADRVKEWAVAFQNLSPQTQKFIVIAGALAAALGPLLAAVGLMVTAMAPLAGVLLAIVSPLGILAAVAASAAYAIYSNWDALRARFPVITGAIEAGAGALRAGFGKVSERAQEVASGLAEIWRQGAATFAAVMAGDWKTALDQAGGLFETLKTTVWALVDGLTMGLASKLVEFAKRVGAGTRDVLVGGLRAAFDAAVAAVAQFGADLVAALGEMLVSVAEAAANIGREIVAGIKRGLVEKWEDLKTYIRGLGDGLATQFKDVLGIHSPSRVFAQFGRWIVDGLVGGLNGGLGQIGAASDAMAAKLDLTEAAAAAETMGGALRKVGGVASQTFSKIGGLIGEGLRGLKSWREVLAGVLQTLAQVLAEQAKAQLVGLAGGASSPLGGLVGGLFGSLLGFKDGGQFQVGGAGGIDSQIVAFRASPDETVTITKPGQEFGDGRGGGSDLVPVFGVDSGVQVQWLQRAQVNSMQLMRGGMETQRRGMGAALRDYQMRGTT